MDFEEIYRTYFRSVYQYILRLSGSEHIAEEITAETFFRAMKSIGEFRGACDMRVWLCQIAKNAYLSDRKKSSRTVSADEAGLENIADAATMEEQLAARDEAQRIRAILRDIPEPYKEVFMWRVFGELSFREIGSLYGKSDNWACVTCHRARKLIQSRWEEMEHEK